MAPHTAVSLWLTGIGLLLLEATPPGGVAALYKIKAHGEPEAHRHVRRQRRTLRVTLIRESPRFEPAEQAKA